eukprot:6207947-Pleurochrysis_carterae.AAC.1
MELFTSASSVTLRLPAVAASLKDISQHPSEEEILFPPLAALEVNVPAPFRSESRRLSSLQLAARYTDVRNPALDDPRPAWPFRSSQI